jgi:hypothetical protein
MSNDSMTSKLKCTGKDIEVAMAYIIQGNILEFARRD